LNKILYIAAISLYCLNTLSAFSITLFQSISRIDLMHLFSVVMYRPIKYIITCWLIYQIYLIFKKKRSILPDGFPTTKYWYSSLGLGVLWSSFIMLLIILVAMILPEVGPLSMVGAMALGIFSFAILPAIIMVELGIYQHSKLLTRQSNRTA
jgi:hypothetical protein